jgi:hypothetical protein
MIMEMSKRKRWSGKVAYPILACVLMICAASPGHAFTAGETYDKSNWEEIKEFGPPPLIDWVKKGEFVIQTTEIDFEWKITDPGFLEASRKNAGKFAMDEKGYTVEKESGKRPDFLFGLPFPDIAPSADDPQAGAKLMENYWWAHYRTGAFASSGLIRWVGKGGKEREVIVGGDYMFYQGRARGPVRMNAMRFLNQQMIYVVEPFDLRGTTQMIWIYDDDRMDTSFAYVPMLRRLRRTSPSTRSDPFLGTDLCADDAYAWSGKNQTMEWKFVGEGKVLAPLTDNKNRPITEDERGIELVWPTVNMGWEVPEWQGAPWAPVDAVWIPRDVWIVDAMPKDKFYNYGRTRYYLDKSGYDLWFKEIYNKADEYWKTVFVIASYQETQKGRNMVGRSTRYYIAIDDKTHHASTADVIKYPGRHHRYDLPEDIVGPEHFTASTLLQISK